MLENEKNDISRFIFFLLISIQFLIFTASMHYSRDLNLVKRLDNETDLTNRPEDIISPLSSTSLEWNKTWGTLAADYSFDLDTDSQDNVYMAGRWGGGNNYLIKFNSTGDEQWSKIWGSYPYSDAWGVGVDKNTDDVYLAGYFGPWGGPYNISLVKYNSDGIEQWNATWGGDEDDLAYDVAVDSQGYVYLIGYTKSLRTGTYDADLLLIKYNNSGQEEWYRTFKGINLGEVEAYGYGLALDPSGNIYVTGRTHFYYYSMSYDYLAVLKYNSSGDRQWYKTYGADAEGRRCAVDSEGYLYVTGKSKVSSTTYACLLKYDSDGNSQFSPITWQNGNLNTGFGIATDSHNYVYIHGNNYNGDWSSFTLKYSNTGTLIWTDYFNTSADEDGRGVSVDSDDHVYCCGYTDSVGNQDFYLIKYTNTPGPFNLSSDAETPKDINGQFNLNWNSSTDAINYTVYQSNQTITEINENVTLIAEGLTETSYPISLSQNGTTYYIIYAFNIYGNLSSNCISVEVEIAITPPEAFELFSNAENPDKDGNFNLHWDISNYAENYSLYWDDALITNVNDANLIVAGNINRTYDIFGKPDGKYYFIVMAFNVRGNQTSNCLEIIVQLDSNGGNQDTGFNIVEFLLSPIGLTIIGALGAGSILGITIIKRKRSEKLR